MTSAKGLDFLVFLDKDVKPSTHLVLVGHKRTHTTVSKRVGDVDPGGTVWPTFPGVGGLSVRRDLNTGIPS